MRSYYCLGCGKTAITREKLQSMDKATMTSTTINLNSFSDAPSLQSILEQPLEKKSGELKYIMYQAPTIECLNKEVEKHEYGVCMRKFIVPTLCMRRWCRTLENRTSNHLAIHHRSQMMGGIYRILVHVGVRYGPPGSKRLVYFIDDMNMPFVDKYDTQSAIELMRQSIDYKGWFDKVHWHPMCWTLLFTKNVYGRRYLRFRQMGQKGLDIRFKFYTYVDGIFLPRSKWPWKR